MSVISNHHPEVIDEQNALPVEPCQVRTRKPRPKLARRVRLAVTLNAAGHNGLIAITVGKAVDTYYLNRLPADWGMGFSVEKIGSSAGPYHVNLDGDNRSCDCIGHERHGHCKHADGVACLVRLGKLNTVPVTVPVAA